MLRGCMEIIWLFGRIYIDERLLENVGGTLKSRSKEGSQLEEKQNAKTRTGKVKQVVILGAGLDGRAYRINWPPGVRIYELDKAELFDFKSRVLSIRSSSRFYRFRIKMYPC